MASLPRKETWLLITAHPDDESMFFIPTLRNIIGRNQGEQRGVDAVDDPRRRPRYEGPAIQVLCLSNGDYRDVAEGPIRAQEMRDACTLIGIRNSQENGASAVTVLDDTQMKDGPNEVWSADFVSQAVLEHIRQRVSPTCYMDGKPRKPTHESLLPSINEEARSWCFMEKQTAQSSKGSTQSININLLTFDQGGVSRHPNHLDTYRGVQCLLNEKCNIIRGKSAPTAKLWLCPETNTTNREKSDNILELDVAVYTLTTIPNPLQKYLLWVLVDLMPFLFHRLCQTFLYLLHFLMGGVLWGKEHNRIPPFSGEKSTQDGNYTQYRSLEPLLVWRAMAAHRSQFVWYRRLSVLFSRYTYINDVQKLTIDTPPDSDEDDDSINASLLPLVTIKEENSSPNFLLTPSQMTALRAAVIPAGLQHRPWKRIYSLTRDGDSFVAFQGIMEEWNRKQQGDPSTLLIVKTTSGHMIGGFADVPLVALASNTIVSAARSCLFKVRTLQGGDDPVVEVYGKQLSASKEVLCNTTRRMIAFGGGTSDGGSDAGFGLCLGDGFARGTTARCAAFQNEPLVSDQDGVFAILDVEVWGFVFGQF